MMKLSRFSVFLPVLALIFALAAPLAAQEGPLVKEPPKNISPEQVIQRFAAKESEFMQARDQYTWRQTIKVQTLDGDTPDGEYQMVFDVLFDNKGRRTETVVFAPQPTLQRISMSREDFEDMRNVMPFAVTSETLPEYDILYVGHQKIDELDTFVFDVAPKRIEKGKRYYQGRIWVDDRDYQIVKTTGKTVPDIREKGQENLFPQFSTWREQVDGRYWFPTYTRAEDTLRFRTNDVKIRIVIKYTNYKRFGAKSRITYEGQEVEKANPGQTAPQPATPEPK